MLVSLVEVKGNNFTTVKENPTFILSSERKLQ
jgi:hypothetical protein